MCRITSQREGLLLSLKFLRTGLTLWFVICLSVGVGQMAATPVFAANGNAGHFVVDGDPGSWSYSDNVLHITGSAPLVISLGDNATVIPENGALKTTVDRIVVDSGVTANITLDNVRIQSSSAAAFDMTGATVNLTIKGYNALQSTAMNIPGFRAPSGSTLTIDATDASAFLGAAGGNYAAGIGGKNSEHGGTITINSGRFQFISYNGGAGIGGGYYGNGGTVTINGGTIIAAGGGASIGLGYFSDRPSDIKGTLTITGGSVMRSGVAKYESIATNGTDPLNLVTVNVTDGAGQPAAVAEISAVTINGLGYTYGITDVKTDINGKLYFWLPDGINENDVSVTVKSAKSSNADLSDLALSSGTLSPVFTAGTTSYTASVGNDVTSITVTPTVADSKATVTVNGTNVTSGTASSAISLNTGTNTITVVVTAEDGSTKTYTVVVTRAKSNNADLSGLLLSSGTLSPVFSSGTTSYTASVGNDVTSITVTPTVADSKATVTVNGTGVASGIPSGVISLNTGDTTITIVVTAEDGATKTYTVTVTRKEASPDPGETPPPPVVVPARPETNPGLGVMINGVPREQVATSTVTEDDGIRTVTVRIDASKLINLLTAENDNTVVTIPVAAESDKFAAVLTGDAVKTMESKKAVLEFDTPIGSYKLPAAELLIDNLSDQFGERVALSDIVVNVSIGKSDANTIRAVESAAESGQFALVVPPVDFIVTAAYNGKTVQVAKFNSYVKREIPIPDDVDPGRITTAVITEKDGTSRHDPTYVTVRNGRTFAIVNSLTNSTYSLIWRNVAFVDMKGHWAQKAVNDMASRMVVKGSNGTHFNPDAPITRSQFAAIVTRALGLPENGTTTVFNDVTPGDWYMGAVAKAYEYGIIQGFEDGTFRPDRMMTREEAMVMIARAMQWTGLRAETSGQDAVATLSLFTDGSAVSGWAIQSVASTVNHGLVQGSNAALNPKQEMTRAETAMLVRRLLIRSNLINDR